jgi:uncharacterized repeat protein (TIGR01451 family)
MRLIYPLAAGAILTACLAGWVALAWGQPNFSRAPAPSDPPGSVDAPPAPINPPAMPSPTGPIHSVSADASVPPPPVTMPANPGTETRPPEVPNVPNVPPPPDSAPLAPPPSNLPPPLTHAADPIAPPLLGSHISSMTPPPALDVPPPAEYTLGKQEPSVSIEWVGPPMAKVGVPTEYVLVVRNTGNVAVRDVKANVVLPPGLHMNSAEPRDEGNGVWSLGALEAKQEKTVQLKLVAETRGDLTPQAFVHFASVAALRVKVREPKLVVKANALEKVMIGDMTAFTITVSNPGDGNADQVRIQAMLSEGLENVRGPKVDFEIGSLGAGESRSVQIMCVAKLGGAQMCKAVATADGDLSAHETATVNVMLPRLDLQVVGPGLRYLDRKALYTIKVTNPGDAPATNVTVSDVVPAGFKVLAASNGGRHDANTRTVSWFVGEIGPGQEREVQLEVLAVNPGHHTQKALAIGTRNLHAEGEVSTNVEGLSALGVEMTCTENPVEVNGETAYDIHINNTGSKTETDIKLVAEVPPQMQFKSATGPASYKVEGNKIIFDTLPALAPRAEAPFHINVKAIEPGTVRFKIQVTSTNLVEPVIQMEATRIYSDAPPEPVKP